MEDFIVFVYKVLLYVFFLNVGMVNLFGLFTVDMYVGFNKI